MVAHLSFMIWVTSLLNSNQSTAPSLRAMKLSRLIAPPKITLRMFYDTPCHIYRIKSAVSITSAFTKTMTNNCRGWPSVATRSLKHQIGYERVATEGHPYNCSQEFS